MQRAVTLNNASDDTSVFFGQKLDRVIAHIAKPLHNNALTFQRAGQARRSFILIIAEKLTQRILHTATRGLCATLNTACVNRLTRHTCSAVNIGRVHALILVGNPRHFTLSSAHIWGRYVLRWMDQIALNQLIGKTAGDLFQLMRFPLGWINA